MKKILSLIFTLAICVNVWAKENITIYYAWGPADSVANYSRTLAAEANKLQNKYTFIFDTKPGAGGAIAATGASRAGIFRSRYCHFVPAIAHWPCHGLCDACRIRRH